MPFIYGPYTPLLPLFSTEKIGSKSQWTRSNRQRHLGRFSNRHHKKQFPNYFIQKNGPQIDRLGPPMAGKVLKGQELQKQSLAGWWWRSITLLQQSPLAAQVSKCPPRPLTHSGLKKYEKHNCNKKCGRLTGECCCIL